ALAMSWVTKLGSGRGSTTTLCAHSSIGVSGTRAVPVPPSASSARSALAIANTVNPAQKPAELSRFGTRAAVRVRDSQGLCRPGRSGSGPASKRGFQIVYELRLGSKPNLALSSGREIVSAVPKRGAFDRCPAASLRHPGLPRRGRLHLGYRERCDSV